MSLYDNLAQAQAPQGGYAERDLLNQGKYNIAISHLKMRQVNGVDTLIVEGTVKEVLKAKEAFEYSIGDENHSVPSSNGVGSEISIFLKKPTKFPKTVEERNAQFANTIRGVLDSLAKSMGLAPQGSEYLDTDSGDTIPVGAFAVSAIQDFTQSSDPSGGELWLDLEELPVVEINAMTSTKKKDGTRKRPFTNCYFN